MIYITILVGFTNTNFYKTFVNVGSQSSSVETHHPNIVHKQNVSKTLLLHGVYIIPFVTNLKEYLCRALYVK